MASFASRTAAFVASALLAASLPSAVSGAVSLTGLSLPTSFAWLDDNHIFASEKAGIVKMYSGWNSTAAPVVVLNISSNVASYGDHGLTSLDVYNNYLYATYSIQAEPVGAPCTDNGVQGNRTDAEVLGCKTLGRLSRWPITVAGGSTTLGAEEPIYADDAICAQFFRGPISYVLVDQSNGDIFLSAGTGADDNEVDIGQFGNKPCEAPGTPAIDGAFRAQNDAVYGGKVIRFAGGSGTPTIVVKGVGGPWRFAMAPSQLYVAATGATDRENIYGPASKIATAPANYGFPCYEGNITIEQYYNVSNGECAAVLADVNFAGPFYYYTRPANGRASISAISYSSSENKLYYGDYSMGGIYSINMNATGYEQKRAGVFPVDIAEVPSQGMVYVDIVRSGIFSVATPTPTPSPNSAVSTSTLGALALGAVAMVASLLL